jgi:hypothetical protein
MQWYFVAARRGPYVQHVCVLKQLTDLSGKICTMINMINDVGYDSINLINVAGIPLEMITGPSLNSGPFTQEISSVNHYSDSGLVLVRALCRFVCFDRRIQFGTQQNMFHSLDGTCLGILKWAAKW